MVTVQIYLDLSDHILNAKELLYAPSTQLHRIYKYAHRTGRNKKSLALWKMQNLQLHILWLALICTERYFYFSDKQKSKLNKTVLQIKKANLKRTVPGNALGDQPVVCHGQI